MNDLFQHSFKAMSHELGHDRPRDSRPMWQRRLSCESAFCKALVACGYLTQEQMQRATQAQKAAKIDIADMLFPPCRSV